MILRTLIGENCGSKILLRYDDFLYTPVIYNKPTLCVINGKDYSIASIEDVVSNNEIIRHIYVDNIFDISNQM